MIKYKVNKRILPVNDGYKTLLLDKRIILEQTGSLSITIESKT